MVQIAIFASGNGSNCENIIRYFSGHSSIRVALVLSNKADAYALIRAHKYHIPTEIVPKEKFNDEAIMMPLLSKYHIDFIVLAGFLVMIPSFLISAYDHRMVNLHPALLPKYGGKGMYGHHVHEAVKAAGDTETGMTIHWVSNVCDGEEILAQYKIPLLPTDTPEDIAAKEQLLEQKHFPQAIEKIIIEHTEE